MHSWTMSKLLWINYTLRYFLKDTKKRQPNTMCKLWLNPALKEKKP